MKIIYLNQTPQQNLSFYQIIFIISILIPLHLMRNQAVIVIFIKKFILQINKRLFSSNDEIYNFSLCENGLAWSSWIKNAVQH